VLAAIVGGRYRCDQERLRGARHGSRRFDHARDRPGGSRFLGRCGAAGLDGRQGSLGYPSRSAYGDIWDVPREVRIVLQGGDDLVAFTGSPNETEAGVFWNFEQIAVFAASELEAREAQRVRDLRADFDALWEDTTEGLDVIPFPEAARRQLLQHQPDSPPQRPTRPVHLRAELFPHQEAAITAWRDAGSRGILEMATGTGKTITALAAAVPSLKAKELVLVIVPGVDLLSQWEEVIRERVAGAAIITCGGGNQWTTRLAPFLTRWRLESARPGLGAVRASFVIATLDTAASERFLSYVRGIENRSLLIIDEVHRAGSPFRRSALRIGSGKRLGLSATPERAWDRDGNKAIEEGIGQVVFRFPLKDAVGTYLTPYDYRPRLISLTDDERVAYADLSRKIQDAFQALAAKYPQARRDLSMLLQIADPSDAGQLELLLYQRADVLKEAEGKLAMVADVARDQTVESCLIYCNDEAQVQHVVDLLRREGRSWGVFTTARVAGQQRKTILRDFGESLFDFLVAIRCLDEGVDMPGAAHALILASNRSEREFIQRRGRILRRSPGKEFSVIHDPVVVPFSLDTDGGPIGALSSAEVGIVARELERVELFASAARNDVEALGFIHDVRRLIQQASARGVQDQQ